VVAAEPQRGKATVIVEFGRENRKIQKLGVEKITKTNHRHPIMGHEAT